METELTNMLINAIPQGGFAGFLFYLFHTVRKELHDVRQEQKSEEQQLRVDYKTNEESLRARYDSVIDNLQKERDGFKLVLQDKIGELHSKITSLEIKLVELATRTESILEKIADLRNRP